jgi:acetylornithine deacetylase/succinyl-diaminopimelate desuccinylase-like protein
MTEEIKVAEASVWVDTLIRFKQKGSHPRRDVKMALTCGEETANAFNGASYLATHERTRIDAAFALNESGCGGGGGVPSRFSKIHLRRSTTDERFAYESVSTLA